MFLVGPEIAPGRYRASGNPEACGWARLRDFSFGDDPSAAARGNVIESDRSASAGIAPTDAGFLSLGCGQWTPVP